MWDWVDDLLGEGGTQPLKVSEDTRAARRPSLLVQGGGQGGGGSSGLWDFLGDDATSSDEDEEEEEKDEDEDEEERYLSETKKKRVAARVGSAIERWALRCTDSAILADLATGCRCGCVHNVLTLGEVARARLEQKAFDCTERRDDLRRFLDMNGAPSRSLGFNLHGDDSLKPLCVAGYAVRSGNRLAWLYKHIKAQRKGNGFDDPNLGGNRRRGKCGSDMDEDSPQFMSAYGHMKELRRDTDVMPNSRERHLDYGEINEFYAEYVADAKEADGGLEVASIDVWRGVWKGHFSDVKIREIKAVSGKNVKRAELRRLLRRTVTPARAERDTIKCVRQLFRDSLRRERGFYWEIRLLPGRYPEGYTTAITDGATQKEYELPRYCQVECKRPGFCFKLVATLFHSHVLVLHLVCPHINDDSNLTCHIIDTSLEVLLDVRKEKGLKDYLPDNFRLQVIWSCRETSSERASERSRGCRGRALVATAAPKRRRAPRLHTLPPARAPPRVDPFCAVFDPSGRPRATYRARTADLQLIYC